MISNKSSRKLIVARTAPDNKAKKRSDSIIPIYLSAAKPIYHEITIARPPPLGVGWVCELLILGISNIFFLTAIFKIKKVPANEVIRIKDKIILN